MGKAIAKLAIVLFPAVHHVHFVHHVHSKALEDNGNFVLYQFKWQAGTYRAWNGGVFPYDSCFVSDTLYVGQVVQQGQCLENTHNTTFALMDNGNLEIYDRQLGQITWQSYTMGKPDKPGTGWPLADHTDKWTKGSPA